MADFLGDFAIEKLVITFVCALQLIVVLNFFFSSLSRESYCLFAESMASFDSIDTVPIESMDFIVADTEGSVHPVTLKARVSPTTAARGADRFMVCSFLRHLVNAVFGWLIRLIISAYLAER